MLGQELNRYWKTVVNTIQDGVMIVDTEGTIVSANKALQIMTGYTKEELIGKPCMILNCNICEIARERKGEKWCSLFQTGLDFTYRFLSLSPPGILSVSPGIYQIHNSPAVALPSWSVCH